MPLCLGQKCFYFFRSRGDGCRLNAGQVSLTLVRHSKLFKGAMADNLCAEVRQLTFGIESVIDATQVCGALQLFNCLAVLSAALQVNGFVPKGFLLSRVVGTKQAVLRPCHWRSQCERRYCQCGR